jgi:sulfur carrier protein
MTKLHVNGSEWESAAEASLADLVAVWCHSSKGVAVAINGEVVPRSTWEHTVMRSGDRVEIVTAAAGG